MVAHAAGGGPKKWQQQSGAQKYDIGGAIVLATYVTHGGEG